MKLAIQGHPTRGKEVIQILESLRGRNTKNWYGNGDNRDGFFINDDGIIEFDNLPKGYKLYTLEEFEKEFPFKVGDKVQNIYSKNIGTIVKICYNPATTIAYKVQYNLDHNLLHSASQLELYKEMKKERNITLTLDKAKEWYKKGGELKEIALQAFSEKELNPLPRSWEEFATNHARMGYYISSDGKPLMCASSGKLSSPHVCPSKESAEAHLAMIQLEQLRNCWWNGWKPEWSNSEKYVIKWEGDNLIVFTARRVHAFLVFPTREIAEEFLKCFRDLIEKAGDLI